MVAMELAARLEALGARLEAQWAPREYNQEADDLSNMKTSDFVEGRRQGSGSANSLPLVVIPHMFKVAAKFHEEILSKPPGNKSYTCKGRKRVKLKDREPW